MDIPGRAHFPLNSHFIVSPAYSPDGKRIAFRRGVGQIYYYDGTAWKNFGHSAIAGKSDDNTTGPPWFAADGSLGVNLRPKSSWCMDASGKWAQIPFESHYPDDIWSEGTARGGRPAAPQGCVTRYPESIVQDNLGTCWLTWKGQLYRAVPGRCLPVFAPGEPNPFISPQDLREVFVDPRGNALIESAAYRMNWYIVKPKAPPPQATIALERTGEDSLVAHLDPHTTGEVTFHWQLDNGEWQNSADRSLPFDHLPNGPHTLRVTATTEDLNSQATPTEATFSIHIDVARQIAGLVAQLNSPDYAKRKAAVEDLARQPSLAIPALEKARPAAGPDNQWWIDVALQAAQSTTHVQ